MSEVKRMFIPCGHEEELLGLLRLHYNKNVKFLFPKYVSIISRLIFYQTYQNRAYQDYGVAINLKTLSKIIGERDGNTKRIIDNLVDWKYIELHTNYYAGKHSRTYKLHNRFDDCRYSMLSFTAKDGKMIRKILAISYKEDSLISSQFDILRKKVTISGEGLNFLRNKYSSLDWDTIVDSYKQGNLSNLSIELARHIEIAREDMGLFSFLVSDFWIHRNDPKSRLYTNLCTLKREYRKYLLLNGKPLLSTDLVNSQLVFAIPVVEHYLNENPEKFDLSMADDLLLYRDLAQQGCSYESVAAFAGMFLEFHDRALFKARFYKDIFFSRVSKKRSRVKDAFNSLFPVFAEGIADIKREDYTLFAIMCQRAEAYIMIDRVLRQLTEMGITALSLHDSIFVNNDSDLELAENLIRQEMSEHYDLRISFKRETGTVVTTQSPLQAIDELAKKIKGFNPKFDETKWKRQQTKALGVNATRTLC